MKFCSTSIIALLFFSGISAFGIGNYKAGQKLYVQSSSGINIRDAASADGKKLGLIPYGAQVDVISADRNVPYTTGDVSGYWVNVSYGKIKGFVFDGFLSRLPAPKANCTSLDDYIEKNFKPDGKEELVCSEEKKIKKSFHPTLDCSIGFEVMKQKYQNGIYRVFFQGGDYGGSFFVIEDISYEEAFFLCRRFSDHFKNTTFQEFKKNNYSIKDQKERCTVGSDSFEACTWFITIKELPGGAKQLDCGFSGM